MSAAPLDRARPSAVWADGLIDLPSGQVVQRGDMVRLLPLSALIGA